MTEQFDADAALASFGSEEKPAAEGSLLAGLRERRQERRKRLHLDLAVPGLTPPVYVRYKPINLGRLNAVLKAAEKSKDRDAIVIANASTLVDACVGVFVIDENGDETSVDPASTDWPVFGQRLGELLAEDGETFAKATDVVRALFDNDIAMVGTADRLVEWSRTLDDELERETAGN